MNKSSYELMNSIMNILTEIDDLQNYMNDNTTSIKEVDRMEFLYSKLTEEFEGIELKADKFGYLIRKLESEENYFKDEAMFFSKKAKRKKSQIENIKKRIMLIMETLQLNELKGSSFTLKFGKISSSLEVDELTEHQKSEIPDKYKITNIDINNSLLKEDLLKGFKFPFARIINKQNLLIK